MSRDFTKNVSNYMSCGLRTLAAALNGATQIAVSMWVQVDTITALVNNNRFLSIMCADGFTGVMLGTDASSHLRVGARSVSTDTFQTKDTTTVIATSGAWTHLGAVIDISGDVVTPYINGVAEGGGAVTFANTTFTNGATHVTTGDTIGGSGTPPSSTDGQVDGRIGEVGIWMVTSGTVLTADDFTALNAGFSPALIQPSKLLFYMPMQGKNSPERNLRSTISGTITGSLPEAAHPRIIYPSQKQTKFGTVAAPGGVNSGFFLFM